MPELTASPFSPITLPEARYMLDWLLSLLKLNDWTIALTLDGPPPLDPDDDPTELLCGLLKTDRTRKTASLWISNENTRSKDEDSYSTIAHEIVGHLLLLDVLGDIPPSDALECNFNVLGDLVAAYYRTTLIPREKPLSRPATPHPCRA